MNPSSRFGGKAIRRRPSSTIGGVLVLFFFWIYGIVAFVRDVKNTLVPAYRQYRRDDESEERGAEAEPEEDRLRELYGS